MFRCVPLITERLRFNTETQYSRARANINAQTVSRVSASRRMVMVVKQNGRMYVMTTSAGMRSSCIFACAEEAAW